MPSNLLGAKATLALVLVSVAFARAWAPAAPRAAAKLASRLPTRPSVTRRSTACALLDGGALPVSNVLGLDAIQTFRDSWEMAADMLVSRTAAFIVANVLATLAWQGISGALAAAVPKPAKPPPNIGAELAQAASAKAAEVPLAQWLKLIPCLLIDLGGDASYILPFLGDIGDFAWAPTSALLLKQLFGSNAISGVDFVKEALPFTDILPVATIAWALETFAPDSLPAKTLGIKPRS